ncbi:UTP--glucose-1-phosphate uridylyltransferase [Laceyella putida]|uniref:UTP--glucose-1-phosphate uridylyltransferase n=2 Tax=Laceyella putida TaxID=110101 RepID=A0ABW2RLQ3_9BACL
MRLKKAIIPAAGLGQRMLPATRAIPKPMLPVVDRPALQYLVEEAMEAGIEEIAIVVGHQADVIRAHFAGEPRIWFIEQTDLKGTGHALLMARDFVGHEPFAVMLGDIVIDGTEGCLKQLLGVAERVKAPVLAVERLPEHLLCQHNAIQYSQTPDPQLIRCRQVIEKPQGPTPSNVVSIGRYLFPPELMAWLERVEPDGRGEIQLTDAINLLIEQETVYGYFYKGQRYDVGDRTEWLKAQIALACKHSDIRDELLPYVKQLLEHENLKQR